MWAKDPLGFALARCARLLAGAATVVQALLSDLRKLDPLNTFLVVGGGDGSRSYAAPRALGSDWFAGVGFFSLGGQTAGVIPARAIERQLRWRKIYTKNFGVPPEEEVSTVGRGAAHLAKGDTFDIQYIAAECSTFSQAGKQAGLQDPETAKIWDQIFLRLAVEQPRTFVCKNVRGLMRMEKGAVFDWVLKGFRGAGYVTAHRLGSPPTMGKCFNRARVFILGLRLDLVARSWWARMDTRTWFQPRADTVFSVVSHILESPDTPRAILESRGAVFIDDYRLLTGEATVSPRVSLLIYLCSLHIGIRQGALPKIQGDLEAVASPKGSPQLGGKIPIFPLFRFLY
jgi:hypothetical protein